MEGSSNNRQELLGMQVFHCTVCSKPLFPPVYQRSNGSFICWNCHSELRPTSVRDATLRCRSMEGVVESIFVPCMYGCDSKIKYYEKAHHEQVCRVGPCACPYAGCDDVVQAEALLDHLTTLHKLPSLEINYFVPFEHRVEPGTWVLRGKYSRLFLLEVAPPAPGPGSLDHAVFLTCIRPTGTTGCSVSFSCLSGHYDTLKWDIEPEYPTRRLCVVPKVSGGETDVVLSITIDLVSKHDENDVPLEEEEDDEDYESEEEDD